MSYDDQLMQTREGWWVLRNDTHLSRWIEQARRLDHDVPVLQKLAPYIEPGSVVFDLGAAVGDHAIYYLDKVGPSGVVVCFEPHPLEFECLVRNCPKAFCLPYAVGESEGDVWLFHQPDIVAGSRLIDPALGWPMSRVHVVSLDSSCIFSQRVSFIKIDIEGCECAALRGARELIAHHRPTLWIEINELALQRQNASTNELRDVLENQLSYHVEYFYPDDATWDGYDGAQCDALFLPNT